VFAPLNKHAMRLGGLAAGGRASLPAGEIRRRRLRQRVQHHGRLWTSRVTSHIPLRDVAARSRRRRLGGRAHRRRYLKAAGNAAPRIAVAGLNPHAGDGGSIGREEIDIIAPRSSAPAGEGIDAHGPLSPDTVFLAARRGDFDAVVSMYHDQGQIAMKLMGFDSGVTLHGGLPCPSPRARAAALSTSSAQRREAGRPDRGIQAGRADCGERNRPHVAGKVAGTMCAVHPLFD
jgi:4-hydroxythreonine-4-phosphate dehydrogenase